MSAGLLEHQDVVVTAIPPGRWIHERRRIALTDAALTQRGRQNHLGADGESDAAGR